MVFLVPPFFVDGDGERRAPCDDVAVESDYAAVERGPVCIREEGFFQSPIGLLCVTSAP